MELTSSILSILIFLPILGAIVVALLPRPIAKQGALVVSLLTFALSLVLILNWPAGASILAATIGGTATPAFAQTVPWLLQYGYAVSYHLGVDGMSVLLIVLTTFLTPLCILAAWTDIKERSKEFVICLLLLEGAIIGVFSALDMILFYIFWEAVLIPMYLLIGVWGGPRRIYASIKFFLYTMTGSVLMWIAMLYIYWNSGTHSFDYDAFRQAANAIDASNPNAALWLFAAFAFAFAIKVPLFPVHTWLPDAHTEAPTAGSVMLAAVLLKMGTYGFIRFAIPFFPHAAHVAAPLMIGLAIIGIIYGALVAMMQTDVKRLVAYSSVSHLGFVVLGIFAALLVADADTATISMSGATLQMINHGISTGALFLLVGVIYERRHTRELSQFGGISAVMPRYTVLFWVALFASIGLPGLNGFVGEFLILQGSMAANFWYTFFAATGVILGAVYMLRMFRSMMFGEITREENRVLQDVNPRETFVLVAVLSMALWIGVAPQSFLNLINPSSRSVTTLVRSRLDVDTPVRAASLDQMHTPTK